MSKLIDALDAITEARSSCRLLDLAGCGLDDGGQRDAVRLGVQHIMQNLAVATGKLDRLLEKRNAKRAAGPSPIMVLFEEWSRLHTLSEKTDDDDGALSGEVDDLMLRILAIPPADAQDMAAKVSCLTFLGEHTELDGDSWGAGAGFIRECAALVGCADQVALRDDVGGAA